MITVVRTFDVQQGKLQEAIAWATKMAAYQKETGSPSQPSVVRNINGAIDQLYYVVNWESLAIWEEWIKKGRQDPQLQQLLAERDTVFVAETVNLYETVG